MAASLYVKHPPHHPVKMAHNPHSSGGTPDTSTSSDYGDISPVSPVQQQQQQRQRLLHYDRSNPQDEDNPQVDEFHLSIPTFLLSQHGRGLGQMNQHHLSECLQPVMQSLRNLNAESLLNLERVPDGARLCDGVNVRPIHDEVSPQYDMGGANVSCVRYIHITEIPEQYSIGIFVFPPFARIPLHDHPEMCVLSRLLYGDLQCLSLDLPGAAEDKAAAQQKVAAAQNTNLHSALQHSFSKFQSARDQLFGQQVAVPQPAGFPEGSRRAFKNPVKHLHAPDVSLLFPYKGNLHEFFAGPHGAAVLDILLPPYDMEHDRDCTFYDIREDPVAAAAPVPMDVDQPRSALEEALGLSDPTSRSPCWIVPTNQPHDFHCLSGKYLKLGTNVISMQDAPSPS